MNAFLSLPCSEEVFANLDNILPDKTVTSISAGEKMVTDGQNEIRIFYFKKNIEFLYKTKSDEALALNVAERIIKENQK